MFQNQANSLTQDLALYESHRSVCDNAVSCAQLMLGFGENHHHPNAQPHIATPNPVEPPGAAIPAQLSPQPSPGVPQNAQLEVGDTVQPLHPPVRLPPSATNNAKHGRGESAPNAHRSK